jgi:hypothetical protein
MSTSYRCSDAARQRGETMFATGSQVRGWLLVEVRGAWGEDAVHASALAEHVPLDWKDRLRRRHIRAICVRSHLRESGDDVRLYACAARRPGDEPSTLWRRDIASLAEVAGATDTLSLDEPSAAGWHPVSERLVLVCTNGRHDQCCANLGRPLVRALRESQWAERVWECSHIGGDRFAANVVMLPESVYFGRVEPDSSAELLRAWDEGRIDLTRFRGRTAYSLAEQAVEHFVRTEFGIDGADAVVVDPRADDGSYPVHAGDRVVHVRVRRQLVTVTEPLTCKGRPDQLVPRFTLVSIT